MKEKPILFSGPMVRAILEGRKTQTRRVAKKAPLVPLQPGNVWADCLCAEIDASDQPCLRCVGIAGDSPYGVPGDRLWGRETWYDDFDRGPCEVELDRPARLENGNIEGVEYRATHDCRSFEAGCPCNPDGDGKRSAWRPSIFMPRWASRISLEVTNVRVERLQGISEEDARSEGVAPFPKDPEGDCWTDGKHRTAFEYLWGQINGWDSWKANPWVWVVGFRRLAP